LPGAKPLALRAEPCAGSRPAAAISTETVTFDLKSRLKRFLQQINLNRRSQKQHRLGFYTQKRILAMKKLLMMLLLFAAFVFVPAAMADKAKPSTNSECAKCEKMCEATLSYFQKKGGKYAEAKNLEILKDCISSCKTSAEFQSRKSANTAKVMSMCNEICKQCAQMCKDMKDAKLSDCIKSCEQCASCCEKPEA